MFPYSHEVLYSSVSAPNVVLVIAMLLQQPKSSTLKPLQKYVAFPPIATYRHQNAFIQQCSCFSTDKVKNKEHLTDLKLKPHGWPSTRVFGVQPRQQGIYKSFSSSPNKDQNTEEIDHQLNSSKKSNKRNGNNLCCCGIKKLPIIVKYKDTFLHCYRSQ